MDQSISQLNTLATADQADLYAVVDSSANETKKITQQALEVSIANSDNFTDTLIANTNFTTDLANDSNFVTVLGNNTDFIDILTDNDEFQNNVNNFISTSVSTVNVTQFEDFIGLRSGTITSGEDTFFGTYPWETQNSDASVTITASTTNHPGIVTVANTASNGDGIVWGDFTTFVPNTAFSFEVMVLVPSGDTAQEFFCGLAVNTLGASFVAVDSKIGIVGTGGNWKGITANNTSTTSTSTSAITGDTWYKLGFEFNGTNSVQFFIDGISIGTITTTIPTVNLGIGFFTRNVSGNSSFKIDYMKANYIITR